MAQKRTDIRVCSAMKATSSDLPDFSIDFFDPGGIVSTTSCSAISNYDISMASHFLHMNSSLPISLIAFSRSQHLRQRFISR